MRRYDFFYRQKPTEGEIDAAFDGCENADRAIVADHKLIGIVQNAEVTQHTPIADLTVDITGNAVVYDQLGQRIVIGANETVDVSVDSNGVPTAVSIAGNEKIISVFAKFDRILSDPRPDGTSQIVNFLREESYQIVVEQGPESASPATPPSLRTDAVLLADITRTSSQTAITNADISTERRQDLIAASGTPHSLRAGSLPEAVEDLLEIINDHISAGADSHAYAGGPAWADGTTNPASNVEAQFDKMLTDLSGTDGAKKIGSAAITVGSDATAISAGTVWSQLSELANEYLRLSAGNAVSGDNTFTGSNTFSATNTFEDVQAHTLSDVDKPWKTTVPDSGDDWYEAHRFVATGEPSTSAPAHVYFSRGSENGIAFTINAKYDPNGAGGLVWQKDQTGIGTQWCGLTLKTDGIYLTVLPTGTSGVSSLTSDLTKCIRVQAGTTKLYDVISFSSSGEVTSNKLNLNTELSSASTPEQNELYATNIPRAFGTVVYGDTPTVTGDFNVASASDTGGSLGILVTLSRGFDSINDYNVIVTYCGGSSNARLAHAFKTTANSFYLQIWAEIGGSWSPMTPPSGTTEKVSFVIFGANQA